MKNLLITLAIALLLTTFSCARGNQQLMGGLGGAGGAAYGYLANASPTALALYTIGGVVGGMYIGDAIDQKKQKNRDSDQYYSIQENRERADRLWKEAEERQRQRASTTNNYYSGGGGSQIVNPQPPTGNTNCQKVTTRQWNNGSVVSERTEEVCRGTRSTATY
jgi:hypothetical protein